MRKLVVFYVIMMALVCGLAVFLAKGLFNLTHTAFTHTAHTSQVDAKVDSLEKVVFQLQDSLTVLRDNQIHMNNELNEMKQTMEVNHKIVERMRRNSQITFP